MAILSSGPIENNPVGGIRPTQQVTLKITNRAPADTGMVLIQGFYLDTMRNPYVLEEAELLPGQVVTRILYANFDAYEFVFTTSGPAEMTVDVSLWGMDSDGTIVNAQRIVADDQLHS